jgi:hypothetical protein
LESGTDSNVARFVKLPAEFFVQRKPLLEFGQGSPDFAIETLTRCVCIASMAAFDHWTEVLRCPDCSLAGVATLSQGTTDNFATNIDVIPAGFRAVSSHYGDTFFCEACNRPATASTK